MAMGKSVLTKTDLDHPEDIDYQRLVSLLRPTVQGTYDAWLLYGEQHDPRGPDRLDSIARIRDILQDLGYCGLWSVEVPPYDH